MWFTRLASYRGELGSEVIDAGIFGVTKRTGQVTPGKESHWHKEILV